MSDEQDMTLADTIYHLTNGVGEKPYWRRTGQEGERVTVFVADDCELCEIAFIDNDGDEELAKAICAAGKHLTDLQAANAELTEKLANARKEASAEHKRAEDCWDALSKESKHHNETMEKLAKAEKRIEYLGLCFPDEMTTEQQLRERLAAKEKRIAELEAAICECIARADGDCDKCHNAFGEMVDMEK